MTYTPITFHKDDETTLSEDRADEIRLIWEGWTPGEPLVPYPILPMGVVRYDDDPPPDRPITTGLLLWVGTADPTAKMGDRDLWIGP